jgi:hypothetical protein
LKGTEQRKAFFTGGNSTCQAHIQQHYTLYKEHRKEGNIPENHHAISQPLWKKAQEGEKAEGKQQMTLDRVLKKWVPQEFSCEGILHAISQFIAYGDQITLLIILAWI